MARHLSAHARLQRSRPLTASLRCGFGVSSRRKVSFRAHGPGHYVKHLSHVMETKYAERLRTLSGNAHLGAGMVHAGGGRTANRGGSVMQRHIGLVGGYERTHQTGSMVLRFGIADDLSRVAVIGGDKDQCARMRG